MSKKTDMYGVKRHPGEAYRAAKAQGLNWKALQKEFKRKKRLRKIARLARRGCRPKNTMQPRPI